MNWTFDRYYFTQYLITIITLFSTVQWNNLWNFYIFDNVLRYDPLKTILNHPLLYLDRWWCKIRYNSLYKVMPHVCCLYALTRLTLHLQLAHLIGTYQNRRKLRLSWIQTGFELHNGSLEEFDRLGLY